MKPDASKADIKILAKAAKQRIRQGLSRDDRSTLPAQLAEEERIYRVVCRLLSQGTTVTDPIRQIAQGDLLDTLQGVAKERYVLNLSEIYLRQCDRYRRNNAPANTSYPHAEEPAALAR